MTSTAVDISGFDGDVGISGSKRMSTRTCDTDIEYKLYNRTGKNLVFGKGF